MIFMDYIGNRNKNLSNIHEVWLIVRKPPKTPVTFGDIPVKVVPELSPKQELLDDYLRLKSIGMWNKDTFNNIYVPRFLNGLRSDEDSRNKLNELYALSLHKNVMIMCFCGDEEMCHRSVIYGLITAIYQKHGNPDLLTSGTDKYTGYYARYCLAFRHDGTLCFTGHRPDKLFGYSSCPEYDNLFKVIMDVIMMFVVKYGYKRVITGGAQGIDQIAFWAANKLKKGGLVLSNEVIIPYGSQDSRWKDDGLFGKTNYQNILKLADKKTVISTASSLSYRDACNALYTRNKVMVDNSDTVIAVCNDFSWQQPDAKGGTAHCVKYAAGQQVPIYQIVCNKEKTYVHGYV